MNRAPAMNIVPYGLLQPATAPLESSRVQTDTDGKFTGAVHGKVPVQCILMHTCRWCWTLCYCLYPTVTNNYSSKSHGQTVIAVVTIRGHAQSGKV